MHPENILSILVMLENLAFERSTDSKFIHPSNIPFVVVTEEKSKWEKSTEINKFPVNPLPSLLGEK